MHENLDCFKLDKLFHVNLLDAVAEVLVEDLILPAYPPGLFELKDKVRLFFNLPPFSQIPHKDIPLPEELLPLAENTARLLFPLYEKYVLPRVKTKKLLHQTNNRKGGRL